MRSSFSLGSAGHQVGGLAARRNLLRRQELDGVARLPGAVAARTGGGERHRLFEFASGQPLSGDGVLERRPARGSDRRRRSDRSDDLQQGPSIDSAVFCLHGVNPLDAGAAYAVAGWVAIPILCRFGAPSGPRRQWRLRSRSGGRGLPFRSPIPRPPAGFRLEKWCREMARHQTRAPRLPTHDSEFDVHAEPQHAAAHDAGRTMRTRGRAS